MKTPAPLPIPETIANLESAIDRLTGETGAGRKVSAGITTGTLARITALSSEAARLSLQIERNMPEPQSGNTPADGNSPAQPAPRNENALQKYSRLAATDPAAAGDFYSRHADEILEAHGEAQRASRERVRTNRSIQTRAMQSAHSTHIKEKA